MNLLKWALVAGAIGGLWLWTARKSDASVVTTIVSPEPMLLNARAVFEESTLPPSDKVQTLPAGTRVELYGAAAGHEFYVEAVISQVLEQGSDRFNTRYKARTLAASPMGPEGIDLTVLSRSIMAIA